MPFEDIYRISICPTCRGELGIHERIYSFDQGDEYELVEAICENGHTLTAEQVPPVEQ